jgi:uncharacterized protein (TIGR03437 family)
LPFRIPHRHPSALFHCLGTPGFVGLYQFNVTVPQIPDSDSVPLTLLLNGISTAQTLYTAVPQ